MRVIEYGLYSSEYAWITARCITGRSIIIDGTTSNAAIAAVSTADAFAIVGTDAEGWAKLFIRVALTTLRSLIGHMPVILYAELRFALNQVDYPGSYTIKFYETKLTPDFSDCTYRYRDVTGSVTWYKDAYSPVPGQDIKTSPFDTQTIVGPVGLATTWNAAANVTAPLQDALRRGTNLEVLFWRNTGSRIWIAWTADSSIKRPYLRVYYLFPLEFFLSTAAGEIDLSSMVDNLNDENPYYLGAVERNETGTPVKGFLKNFGSRDLPLIELLDDHPEWTDPVQSAGAGTGGLDYVQLLGTAGSQKYTVQFSSGSAYEIKAEAYRDNIESYHPTYDADPTWQGDTSTDFTAPEGGLVIPATAWQPGTAVADEFEIYVRGNSSDSTWPADSDDQTEMTDDSGGSPVTANWRPINGRRTKTTASVTINATTKKFPCKAIDDADWPMGTRAFVGDGTTLHEGTVASAQEAAIGAVVFSGVGLDDLTLSGNYNGTIEDDLVVQIEDDSASPELFKVSFDGGSTWALTGQECSVTGTAIGYGIIATFGATTGHTNTENWTAPIQPFAVELESLTNDSTVYAAGARLGTSLPIQNLTVAVWGVTTAAAGPSEAVDYRIYLQGPPPDDLDPTSAGFVMAQEVYIVDVTDADIHEYGTIASVAATYIDLDANLTNDYPAGAIVTVRGSGEAAFWLRCVASGSTTEELKEARLNARA